MFGALEMERAVASNVSGPGPYPGQVRLMYICILQTTFSLANFGSTQAMTKLV